MIISDLVDARILVELRNRCSFTETARALNLPAATLSRRVMKMEGRAGIRLFERTSRSVGTTAAGLLAAAHAERILSEAEAVDLSLETLRSGPAGTIRISAPVILGQAVLGPVFHSFLRSHPDCHLAVELTDRPVDLVEETVDIVFRVGTALDGGLLARPLGNVHAALYRALRPSAKAAPASLHELAHLPLGLLHAGHGPTPQLALTSSNGEHQQISVQPRIVCLNPWVLREVALAGDMVVVLPTMMAQSKPHEAKLERILPDWLVRNVPVHLAYTSRRLIRPAVRAFIDFALETLPNTLEEAQGRASPTGVGK